MMAEKYMVAVVFFVVLMSTAEEVLSGEGTLSFTLERAFPTDHPLDMTELKERDRVRHNQILSSSGRVDFPLQGTSDPLLAGIYFTRIQLGSPPKELYVVIDTGSDALWVNCVFCDSCPSWSGLQYGDTSMTSGYIVEDYIHFDTMKRNAVTTSTSYKVFFGCSTSRNGYALTMPKRAFDGILGLGQNKNSVISQLASHGLVSSVFSHCLKGSGGGILVLGQVLEPKIVYTPIVPSKMHYNVDLQSISVNGQPLPINAQVFRGTFIDSGTTYAYLAAEAYDQFINAITKAVSASTRPLVYMGMQCYVTNSSVLDIFPIVTLNFAGASMVLNPEDYLLAKYYIDGAEVIWCVGFQKRHSPDQGMTILGELVLKDKIIVYDLANQRIGWKPYDCSKPIKASINAAKKSNLSHSEQFYGFLVTLAFVWLLL